MFHFKDNFVEVIWKHGSGSESRHGSGRGSNIQIFLEAEAEVEAKKPHFHITVPNNQAAATAATYIISKLLTKLPPKLLLTNF